MPSPAGHAQRAAAAGPTEVGTPATESARAYRQLLELVTASLPIGLLHADLSGRLHYANSTLTEMTGLRAGSRLQDLPGLANHHRTLVNSALSSALRGANTDAAIEVAGAFGDVRHCSLSVRPLFDDAGTVTGITGALEDITASVVERRVLEVRAGTDSLTGCLNRSAVLAVLQDSLDDLSEQAPRQRGVAVVFIDVDGLTAINERMGRAAGDALLVELSERLRGAVRVRDAVGRYGGDEFAVVATNVPGSEQALNLAAWVSSRITRSFAIDSAPVRINASVGVAWTANQGVQAHWLVRHAERAMAESKRLGRSTPVLAGAAARRR